MNRIFRTDHFGGEMVDVGFPVYAYKAIMGLRYKKEGQMVIKIVWPKPLKRYLGAFRKAKVRDGKLVIKIDIHQLTDQQNMFLEFSKVDTEQIRTVLSDSKRTVKA